MAQQSSFKCEDYIKVNLLEEEKKIRDKAKSFISINEPVLLSTFRSVSRERLNLEYH